MLEPSRLVLARRQSGLTATALAQAVGISAQSVHNYEAGRQSPPSSVVCELAKALKVPVDFLSRPAVETLDPDSISFRARTKMTASLRNTGLAAAQVAIELRRQVAARYQVPAVNVPTPEVEADAELAAAYVRSHWQLDERSPAPNMVHLLESKGVAVFSLPSKGQDLDAFAFWLDKQPFILLNTVKSAERSRFDAAHELGHLVLHHADGHLNRSDSEREANDFAASFLMPRKGVRARVGRSPTTGELLREKTYWSVSAVAFAYRLHQMGILTDWSYRNTMVDLASRGYRSSEPGGVPRERSLLFKKVFSTAGHRKVREFADAMAVDQSLLGQLTFGVVPTLLLSLVDDEIPGSFKEASLRRRELRVAD